MMPGEVGSMAIDSWQDPVPIRGGARVQVHRLPHPLYPAEPPRKTASLLALLRHTDLASVLVFTRTKHRAKRVAQQLADAGYGATSLQGNLSQRQRQEALDGFRAGAFQILVATDIAARGIDVSR